MVFCNESVKILFFSTPLLYFLPMFFSARYFVVFIGDTPRACFRWGGIL